MINQFQIAMAKAYLSTLFTAHAELSRKEIQDLLVQLLQTWDGPTRDRALRFLREILNRVKESKP